MFGWLRVRHVIPRVRGTVLDLGCGSNGLIRRLSYGRGIQRMTELGAEDRFDTMTLLAVLNYMDRLERVPTLIACHQRLSRYGRLLVTCITPVGSVLHKAVRPWHPWGMSPSSIVRLIESCGFRLVYHRPFMLGLNRLYVFSKEDATSGVAVTQQRQEIAEVLATHAHRPH